MNTLLTNVRVLDLTDQKGYVCGRILADLGADVIKIERPGGDADRMIPPFIGDIQANDRGLLWLSFNCNKRSLTLDIAVPEGKELFMKLVSKADFVIESFEPGFMDELGIGWDFVYQTNPRCIMTSITPFGQTGPYKNYKGADLVCTALSGWLYLCGDSDRPPVRIAAPQAFLNAGAEAAMASMFAFQSRQHTGEGQHIDVSAQESVIVNSFQAVPFWELNQTNLKRVGPYRTGLTAGVKQRQTWPCRDSFVNFSIIGGKAGSKTNAALVRWMNSEGRYGNILEGVDWDKFDMANVKQDQLNQMEKAFTRFFLDHDRDELYSGALERGIMLCPVSDAKDITDSQQLEARGFWTSLDYPPANTTIRYPSKIINSPGVDIGVRIGPPMPGQHNKELYVDELGLGQSDIDVLSRNGVI